MNTDANAPASDSSAGRSRRRALRVVGAATLVAAILLLLAFIVIVSVIGPSGCEDADLEQARSAMCNSGGPGAAWRTAGYLTSLLTLPVLAGAIVYAATRRKARVLIAVVVLGFVAQFVALAFLSKDVNPDAQPALRLDDRQIEMLRHPQASSAYGQLPPDAPRVKATRPTRNRVVSSEGLRSETEGSRHQTVIAKLTGIHRPKRS